MITIYAQIARDKHDEMLRNAEQSHSTRPVRRNQPNLLNQLKSQLADWAELARPQRNRAKRA